MTDEVNPKMVGEHHEPLMISQGRYACPGGNRAARTCGMSVDAARGASPFTTALCLPARAGTTHHSVAHAGWMITGEHCLRAKAGLDTVLQPRHLLRDHCRVFKRFLGRERRATRLVE